MDVVDAAEETDALESEDEDDALLDFWQIVSLSM
jgi:hypothetical protein